MKHYLQTAKEVLLAWWEADPVDQFFLTLQLAAFAISIGMILYYLPPEITMSIVLLNGLVVLSMHTFYKVRSQL